MPKVGRRSRTYKKSNKRRPRRRITKMALYKAPHSFGPKQYAHVRESIEFQSINSNQMYGYVFALGEFQRANSVSTNFKFYRAARVTYTYEPMFNTYPNTSGAGAPGIPYFYVAMNRTQDGTLGNSVNNLLAMGAKPKKLSKIIKVSYVPNWCSPGLLVQNVDNNNITQINQMGSKSEYGWLPCPPLATPWSSHKIQGISPFQPLNLTVTGDNLNGIGIGIGNTETNIVTNGVFYNGHVAYIEQINRSANTLVKCTVTVDWVFKDPQSIYAIDGNTLKHDDVNHRWVSSGVNVKQDSSGNALDASSNPI